MVRCAALLQPLAGSHHGLGAQVLLQQDGKFQQSIAFCDYDFVDADIPDAARDSEAHDSSYCPTAIPIVLVHNTPLREP